MNITPHGWFHNHVDEVHTTLQAPTQPLNERTWQALCAPQDLSFQSTLLVEQAESPFFDVSALKPFSFIIHPSPTNTLLQTLILMAFYKVENNFFSYSSVIYCIYFTIEQTNK